MSLSNSCCCPSKVYKYYTLLLSLVMLATSGIELINGHCTLTYFIMLIPGVTFFILPLVDKTGEDKNRALAFAIVFLTMSVFMISSVAFMPCVTMGFFGLVSIPCSVMYFYRFRVLKKRETDADRTSLFKNMSNSSV